MNVTTRLKQYAGDTEYYMDLNGLGLIKLHCYQK
jgi:hypothetical protein